MTFAIITPGLVVGAFVERIKFSARFSSSPLSGSPSSTFPVCHWVWASEGKGTGWMFANGHHRSRGRDRGAHHRGNLRPRPRQNAGTAHADFPKSLQPPHNPGMVMIGAAMLWVGWFGFNAGSQVAANEAAGMTMLVTHIAAATASLTWMAVEWIKTGKPGLVGIVTGMVAGLATITPASGSVGPIGALILGFLAGFVCYFACGFIKEKLRIDDTLDVFAVHGVGGMMGTILVAFLGIEALGGNTAGKAGISGKTGK